MQEHLFYMLGGTVALTVGADYAVRASLSLAHRWGWPDWVAGMLLLALGTSLPELFVSLTSLSEHPQVALGNLMGSNAFNVAAVLGMCLLLKGKQNFEIERIGWPALLPLVIGSFFVFLWFSYPPSTAYSSILLLLLYGVVIAKSIKAKPGGEVDVLQDAPVSSSKRVGLQCLSGFLMLAGGAHFFLEGALELAAEFGWKDGFAGFVLAAVGTSLPELFTSFFALKQGRAQAVFGNVVGSNAFNLLVTGGIVGLFTHQPFSDEISLFMLCVNLGASLLLIAPLLMLKLHIPNPRSLHSIVGFIMLVSYLLIIQQAYSL
ncbi:MAG: cation:H+ antiporter [Myxococcota bacterium]|jgi:cation:H+ antiporter